MTARGPVAADTILAKYKVAEKKKDKEETAKARTAARKTKGAEKKVMEAANRQ